MPSAEAIVQWMQSLQHIQLSTWYWVPVLWICWEFSVFLLVEWQHFNPDSCSHEMASREMWNLVSTDILPWKAGQHYSKQKSLCCVCHCLDTPEVTFPASSSSIFFPSKEDQDCWAWNAVPLAVNMAVNCLCVSAGFLLWKDDMTLLCNSKK